MLITHFATRTRSIYNLPSQSSSLFQGRFTKFVGMYRYHVFTVQASGSRIASFDLQYVMNGHVVFKINSFIRLLLYI
jgi:hypothetical protein